MQGQTTAGSRYFFWIAIFFVAALLISNTVAGKVGAFGPFAFSVAIILFPLTYICGDILTEVYGFRAARKVIWAGLGATCLMSVVFWLVVQLPPAEGYEGQEAFASTLGVTPRIAIASVAAFFVGEFVNSAIVSRMKIRCAGRYFGLRAITSTVIGQSFDTFVFTVIAFHGLIPVEVIALMILTEWGIKVAYEIIALPATSRVVAFLKRVDGTDVFDVGVRYNPFRLSET